MPVQPLVVPDRSLENAGSLGPGRILIQTSGVRRNGGVGSLADPYKFRGGQFNSVLLLDKPTNPTFRVFCMIDPKQRANANTDREVIELLPASPINVWTGGLELWVWFSSTIAGETVELFVGNGANIDIKGAINTPTWVREQPPNSSSQAENTLSEAAQNMNVSLDQANRDLHTLHFTVRGLAPVRFNAFGAPATSSHVFIAPNPEILHVVKNVVANTFSFLWAGDAASGDEAIVSYQIIGRES